MTVPPQIRELLDACRPDHDDLSAPEMTPLTQALSLDADLRATRNQSAEFDRAIRNAMFDVPVPEGLADRLLARLAPPPATPPVNKRAFNANSAADAAGSSDVDQSARGAVSMARPGSSPGAGRFRRKWLAVSFVAASLIIAAGIGWLRFPASRTPASAEELATNGLLWSEQTQSMAGYNPLLANAPRNRPASDQVRGQPSGWRTLSTPYDSRASTYAIRGQAGDARLFVLRADAVFLRSVNRPQRIPTTGGVAVAAWTEGPLLYVLVVRERQQRLEDYYVPRKLAYVPQRTHVLTAQTPKTVDNGCAA